MKNQSTPLIKQFVALVRLNPYDNSLAFVEQIAQTIISDLKLKVVNKASHSFKPTGITFGYILSQSHLLIHTYPEYGVIHIDLVICVDRSEKDFETALKNAFFDYKVDSIEIKTVDF
jgi:S-adenosylmethionine/arginine decarboxylase-like enzyme